MKKAFSLLIVTLFLFSISVCAFGISSDNWFKGDTELVSVIVEDGSDVADKVALVRYDERDTLDESKREIFEEAYDTIEKASTVTDLNVRLKNVTARNGMIICDLFDLDSDDLGFPVKVTVMNKELGGFIALLQYLEGEWKWVNIDLYGNELVFTADEFSPYIIIVTGAGADSDNKDSGSNKFVPSVSNSGAPRISSATQSDGENVFGLFVITPYDRLDTLPEDLQPQIKDAYASIRDAADVTDLNGDLKAAAGDRTVAVSDLFDIRAVGEVEYSARLVMDADDLSNFVGLLHYEGGEWVWVDTEINGNELSFEVDSLSPFAIVVTVETQTSAQTGERTPVLFIAGAIVLAAASAWFFFKSRKAEA